MSHGGTESTEAPLVRGGTEDITKVISNTYTTALSLFVPSAPP